jgi:hypothetical protein
VMRLAVVSRQFEHVNSHGIRLTVDTWSGLLLSWFVVPLSACSLWGLSCLEPPPHRHVTKRCVALERSCAQQVRQLGLVVSFMCATTSKFTVLPADRILHLIQNTRPPMAGCKLSVLD